MSDDHNTGPLARPSADTQVTLLFVALGVLSWYGSTVLTANRAVQFAVLVGVGVVVPTLVNEWRRHRSG